MLSFLRQFYVRTFISKPDIRTMVVRYDIVGKIRVHLSQYGNIALNSVLKNTFV